MGGFLKTASKIQISNIFKAQYVSLLLIPGGVTAGHTVPLSLQGSCYLCLGSCAVQSSRPSHGCSTWDTEEK